MKGDLLNKIEINEVAFERYKNLFAFKNSSQNSSSEYFLSCNISDLFSDKLLLIFDPKKKDFHDMNKKNNKIEMKKLRKLNLNGKEIIFTLQKKTLFQVEMAPNFSQSHISLTFKEISKIEPCNNFVFFDDLLIINQNKNKRFLFYQLK